LGTRNLQKEGMPYEWLTIKQVDEIKEHFALGMKALNLSPDQEGSRELGDPQDVWNFLGIFSKNCKEWAITDLACIRSSVTIVPFFDSLGLDAVQFIVT
jgi:long-chain acyl-CoA synthetase